MHTTAGLNHPHGPTTVRRRRASAGTTVAQPCTAHRGTVQCPDCQGFGAVTTHPNVHVDCTACAGTGRLTVTALTDEVIAAWMRAGVDIPKVIQDGLDEARRRDRSDEALTLRLRAHRQGR